MSLDKTGMHLGKSLKRSPVVRDNACVSEVVVGAKPGRIIKADGVFVHFS